MYSAAKAELQRQRTTPQITDASLQQIKDTLQPEQAKILAEIISKIDPLIKSRENEARLKAQFQSDLSQLTTIFQELVTRLTALENLKTANAEQEKIVLNKLMEVL
jgi:hypothetical protein